MMTDASVNAAKLHALGLHCPRCGHHHFRTSHTEPTRDNRIRRRKTCRSCGNKIVTFESLNGPMRRA